MDREDWDEAALAVPIDSIKEHGSVVPIAKVYLMSNTDLDDDPAKLADAILRRVERESGHAEQTQKLKRY